MTRFNKHSSNDSNPPPQEKGLMATIGGAAAGGYAGNKMSNGGTLGKLGGALVGAIAANKLEHRMKRDKKKYSAPPSNYYGGNQGYGGHGGYGGGYYEQPHGHGFRGMHGEPNTGRPKEWGRH